MISMRARSSPNSETVLASLNHPESDLNIVCAEMLGLIAAPAGMIGNTLVAARGGGDPTSGLGGRL